MNYLAHLYLAKDSTESMIGGILGDFVKGSGKEQYPDKIKKGIELHRKIDSYTDSHPMTQASRRLYRPPWRRFAGVIVDLCCDHFLYRHWLAHGRYWALKCGRKPNPEDILNIYDRLKTLITWHRGTNKILLS